MLAIGNDELGNTAVKGDTVTYNNITAKIEYGTDSEGNESNVMGFITCPDSKDSYLVSINDRLLQGVIKHEK